MKAKYKVRTGAVTYKNTIWVGMRIIIIIAGAAALAKISLLLLLMVFLSFLPSVLVVISDVQHHDKNLLKVVICFNSFGMMPYLGYILSSNDVNSSVSIVMNQPGTWVVIYAFCAIGIVLYLLIPRVAIAMARVRLIIKMKNTRTELNNLHKEWVKKL